MKSFYVLLTLFIALTSCEKKEDPNLTPLEQLPPKTQVGANTAGCLVDGELFLPKGFTPSGNLICNYINQKDFSLDIYDNSDNKSHSVFIESRNLQLKVNEIYILRERSNISQSGEFFVFKENKEFSTTANVNGELIITHHDFNNATISGTFWYDAIDKNGNIVEIREGRFDMEY